MRNHAKHPQHRMFKAGDCVMAHNFAAGVMWLPGRIVENPTGNIVKVKLDDGRIWRRHLDHVVKSSETIEPEAINQEGG